MDSGNSGSLQSSSGDEEYDSRAADSVSAFMSGGGAISNPTPQPPPQPPYFDPLSNFLQLQQNPNSSLLNWPKPSLRSDPNQISHDNNIINSMLPTSSPFMPSFQPPSAAAAGVDTSSPTTFALPPQNQNQVAGRNPKKRSRASRRAPTTVLTTDTTNFRAMVQEFTGIPAPPFNSSSFPRSRLDLFGTRSTTLDAAQPPPYLRRPFPQKVQPSHSLLSSAALDAIAASSPISNNNLNSATAAAASSSTPPSINYQLPIAQNSNPFNVPNPLLTSLLQNPKFPFSTSPVPSNINHPHAKHVGLDEQFGLGHGNHVSETLTAIPNLIPSDQIALRNDHNDNNESNNAARWSNNPDGDKDDGVNLRPLNGNYDFTRNAMNSKMNFSATSTSNFHGGKAPENVAAAARGEGMVESWICSSE